MSSKQVKRGIDVAETLTVDQPVLPFSGGALGFAEKPPEVLAGCLPIPRLMGAANDDVKAGPTRLAEVFAPPSEQRVQLLELGMHGQACGLKYVRREGADVFFDSLEVHDSFSENPVDQITRAAQKFSGCFRCDDCRW